MFFRKDRPFNRKNQNICNSVDLNCFKKIYNILFVDLNYPVDQTLPVARSPLSVV